MYNSDQIRCAALIIKLLFGWPDDDVGLSNRWYQVERDAGSSLKVEENKFLVCFLSTAEEKNELRLFRSAFVDQNDQTITKTTEEFGVLVRIVENQLSIVCQAVQSVERDHLIFNEKKISWKNNEQFSPVDEEKPPMLSIFLDNSNKIVRFNDRKSDSMKEVAARFFAWLTIRTINSKISFGSRYSISQILSTIRSTKCVTFSKSILYEAKLPVGDGELFEVALEKARVKPVRLIASGRTKLNEELWSSLLEMAQSSEFSNFSMIDLKTHWTNVW